MWHGTIERIDEFRWRIPKSYKTGMRVDGMIYADEKMIETIRSDKSLEQVANVATLPGIVKSSMAMPDIHWGYGFPIGGVAATDIDSGGVISPGGVGFDINCGVRLMKTSLCEDEVKPKIRDLVYALYNDIPAGVGSKGDIKISEKEERKLLVDGAKWVVSHGYGEPSDIEYTEEEGAIKGANPDKVSARSYERGKNQSGTLGSGNHFLEIQVIDEVYDDLSAGIF
nr:RtcB family protein [Candidatus Omnitrophota bacterium]